MDRPDNPTLAEEPHRREQNPHARGEIYRARPDVMAVVHALGKSQAVLLWGHGIAFTGPALVSIDK